MSQETYQLTGNAAAIYEEQKVPAMFGPLAEATLDRVPPAKNDIVLDIACGTGIVARKVRERAGPSVRIVGVDLNEGMISHARGLSDPFSRSCEWQICSVDDMPFGDEEFSKIYCQQGFQFFPDEKAALTEIRRVLQPGGVLAMTIWSGPSPLFTILAEAISRFVDDQTAEKSLFPFAFKGRETLTELMANTNFSDVSRSEIAINRTLTNPETSMEKEILGNPVGPIVAQKGPRIMQEIVKYTIEGLSEYQVGPDFILPQPTHLFQGTAS